MVKFITFFSMLLGSLLITTVFSEQSTNSVIGTVVLKLGTVHRFSKGGEKQKVEDYSQVFSGDRVVTGDTGFLKAKMVDDSVIRLGNNTIFLFKLAEITSIGERNSEYFQEKGIVRALFKVKKKPGNVKLSSSAISANIDGAEIVSDLYKSGKSAALQRMAVISGQVKVDLKGERPKGVGSVTVNQGELLRYDPISGTVDVSKMNQGEKKRLEDDKDALLPIIESVEEVPTPSPVIKRTGQSGTSE